MAPTVLLEELFRSGERDAGVNLGHHRGVIDADIVGLPADCAPCTCIGPESDLGVANTARPPKTSSARTNFAASFIRFHPIPAEWPGNHVETLQPLRYSL